MDDRFDGFSVSLHQDSDGAWLACFEERPEISAFGNSPETALCELKNAWCAVKATCEDRGISIPVAPARKQYSGSFNVRIDKALHRALAIEAAHLGISLNAIVAKKLAQTTRFF
jgi:predicted HicB family RNase H-like nuclease